ncbi:MAG: hypothetical protein KGJ93_04985, partial [Patescibacteria group bacterium]|nr:hypothetical protein [Patescibacteria group bacterium]
MGSFVPSLQRLRNTPVDQVIPRLYDMFREVAGMGPEDVVAAYQTLETVALAMDLTQDLMVQQLRKTLIARMAHLAKRVGMEA